MRLPDIQRNMFMGHVDRDSVCRNFVQCMLSFVVVQRRSFGEKQNHSADHVT